MKEVEQAGAEPGQAQAELKLGISLDFWRDELSPLDKYDYQDKLDKLSDKLFKWSMRWTLR